MNNSSAAAVSVGLPSDTPIGILQALELFIQASAVKQGVAKNSKEQIEAKNKAEEALIAYMESKQVVFLEVQGKYLVIQDDTTPLSYSDAFVKSAFMHFMSTPHPGKTLEELSNDFLTFCTNARKSNGTRSKSLKPKKTKPTGALFGQALFGAPM